MSTLPSTSLPTTSLRSVRGGTAAATDADRRVRLAAVTAPRLRWLVVPVLRLVLRLVAVGRPQVRGFDDLPSGPVVVVANHASHVDTVALIAAWPRPLLVAAAEDHFFRPGMLGRVVGMFLAMTIGAFPFPRRGRAGLDRVQAGLRRGHDVLLFPQGTRGGGDVQPGIAVLADEGANVVAVRLEGPSEILPKGAARLCRAAVSVTCRGEVAGDVASVTIGIARHAELASPPTTRPTTLGEGDSDARDDTRGDGHDHCEGHDQGEGQVRGWTGAVAARLRTNAEGPLGIVVIALWSFTEAFVWPLLPDSLLLSQSFAAPRRARVLFVTAVIGTVVGSVAAVALARHGLDWALPWTTERMSDAANTGLVENGAAALRDQPTSGIPVKVYNRLAADTDISLWAWAGWVALARGVRMAATATLGAAAGTVLRRITSEQLRDRLHTSAVIAGTIVLGSSLWLIVRSWS